MDLPDNNILIYALRADTKHHKTAKKWLEDSLNAGRPIRLFSTVEAGFLRVVTNSKIFSPPTPFAEAAEFLRVLCSCPSVEICQWTPSARERSSWQLHGPASGIMGTHARHTRGLSSSMNGRISHFTTTFI